MGFIKSAEELPEVSFIGDISLEDVRAQMVADYCEKYAELTGEAAALPADDKNRLLLGVCALQIYQGFRLIEQSGRMNLLKYAGGDFLDNLAALKDVKRNENAKSTVPVRFVRANNMMQVVITIPGRTRVAATDHDVYWETPDIDVTIPEGRSYMDVDCTCTVEGSFSNGFEYGEITRLIDSVAFVSEIYNVGVSHGGSDYESDDDFRLRILNAPAGYSAAGTADAYRYRIMQMDPQIKDAAVLPGESDGEITVYVMTDTGTATEEQLADFQQQIDNADFRPLTDKVTVESAIYNPFSVDVAYYIDRKNESQATAIRMAVEAAVDEYISEQSNELGKDINPSLLIQKVMNAGASRVIVYNPQYTALNANDFARKTLRVVTYRGLE